jgi:hypothetical protein
MARGPRPCLLVELRSGNVMCFSFGSRFPVEVGSDATTCLIAPGSASSRGELRRCHVFLSSAPRFSVEVGSDAVTWPRPRLSERRAPVLPRTHNPQWVMNHRNKERSSCSGTQLGSFVSKVRSRVTETPARRADIPLQFGSTVQCGSS